MANLTITIGEMLSDPLSNEIFPTDYPFYLEEQAIKKQFEEKFIAHYYYREIGFETPFIFIHKVEERLRLRAPYWKQLYETDLEAKKIKFLLNKDLKETFIREITGNGESSSTGTSTGQTNGTMSDTSESTGTGSSSSNDKQSMLADGVSSVSLTDGYLTGIANNESSSTASQESSNQSSSNTTATSQQTNQQTESNNSTERTELISQGNIGITSSAQLLKEWRQVLINMDEIIINEFEDLFLKIY